MHKEKAKGCCKDEHKQVKIQGEHKSTSEFNTIFLFPIEISIAQVDQYKFLSVSSVTITYPVSNAPPNKALIPLYLSNRVFRI